MRADVVSPACGLRTCGFNGCWKYKSKGAFLYDQAEAHALLADFPPMDILVTHNSPRCIHDREDGIHQGFDALTDYIHLHEPRLVIHGHQHVARETTVGRTVIIGVYGHKWIRV